ncbi:hypothetical protein ABK040_005084 [Willaertia magna]
MIPDDHDILNNLDEWMTVYDNSTSSNLEKEQLRLLTIAGRFTFYEYQYQLTKDVHKIIPTSEMLDKTYNNAITIHNNIIPSSHTIYFFRDIGNACLGFLDFRFERAFRFDANNPLIGKTQLNDVKTFLKNCMNDNENKPKKKIILFTCIPMLFIGKELAIKKEVTGFLDYLDDTYGAESVLFVGGDVHQALLSKYFWYNSRESTISSSLKLTAAHLISAYLLPAPKLGKWYFKRKKNKDDYSKLQHSARRNYGTIEVKENEDKNDWIIKCYETKQHGTYDTSYTKICLIHLHQHLCLYYFSFF